MRQNIFTHHAQTVLGFIEYVGLTTITIATVAAGIGEVSAMISHQSVSLADLLLMFLYLEILAMVGSTSSPANCRCSSPSTSPSSPWPGIWSWT